MSRHSKSHYKVDSGTTVEVKSKFDSDFRRFSLSRGTTMKYEEFHGLLEKLHKLNDVAFLISYTDPRDGDLLPINNDDNLARALLNARPLLRIIIQRKGLRGEPVILPPPLRLNWLTELGYRTNFNFVACYRDSLEDIIGYGTFKHRNLISSILGGTPGKSKTLCISNPHDFRQVSSIIDVDIVPDTQRRVRLLKHGSDRPLGFYIRDGTSVRVTPSGLEKVPGIFISRLVPGGLAESTGLLAVNDEVIEVNGIEVAGKTLDQVTDMMVANSWNLIITVKPANQRTVAPRRGSFSRNSQLSSGSQQSTQSATTAGSDDDTYDHDEVVDLTNVETPTVLHL